MLLVTMHRTAYARGSAAFLGLLALALSGCGGKNHLSRDEGLQVFGDPIKIARDETLGATVASHIVPPEPASVVTFSLTDMPADVTGTFDPPTLDYSVNPSQNTRLNLTASRTAQTGTFDVVARRTRGDGDGFFTDHFRIKVVDFRVDVDRDTTSLSLAPGESKDIDITVTRRGNSNGTVEFDLGGDLPDGVSYSFAPARRLIDADHTRVHTTLTLSADWGATSSGSDKCHVRVLKGSNVDNSGDIDVTLNVPTPNPEIKTKKK